MTTKPIPDAFAFGGRPDPLLLLGRELTHLEAQRAGAAEPSCSRLLARTIEVEN